MTNDSFDRDLDGTIVFSMSELVGTHLSMCGYEKKKFFDSALKINTHDIALLSVMFGKFLKIIISHFKWCHFVQNGRFTRQNQRQNGKIRKFTPCYGTLKFLHNSI